MIVISAPIERFNESDRVLLVEAAKDSVPTERVRIRTKVSGVLTIDQQDSAGRKMRLYEYNNTGNSELGKRIMLKYVELGRDMVFEKQEKQMRELIQANSAEQVAAMAKVYSKWGSF